MTTPNGTRDRPDNTTAHEIKAISERIDRMEVRRSEEQNKGRWIVGILVTIAIVVIGVYGRGAYKWADSIHDNFIGLREQLTELKEAQFSQSRDIAEIRKDIGHQAEYRPVIESMRNEISELKLEIERLKKP